MHVYTHRTQSASQAKLARKNPTKISKAKFLYRVGGKKHPPNNFTPYCYSPLPPKIQCWSAKGGDTCGREKNTRSCRGDPRVGLNIEFWGEGAGLGETFLFSAAGVFFPRPGTLTKAEKQQSSQATDRRRRRKKKKRKKTKDDGKEKKEEDEQGGTKEDGKEERSEE